MAKKWELDLAIKLRTLREEQKRWAVEETSLKRHLEASKEECEKLRKLVCDAEVKELNSKQTMQSTQSQGGEMEKLREEVGRLTASERESQARERERDRSMQEAAEAGKRIEVLEAKLGARESELQQTRAHYQSQMAVLHAAVEEALHGSRGRAKDGDVNAMVESVLAASRAKQLELQKQHSTLIRKYTVLQSSMLDMKCNASPTRSGHEAAASSDADAEVSAIVGSPLATARTRAHRGFSDPERIEAVSFNTTPPLENYGSVSSNGTSTHRPSTPSGQVRSEASGMPNTSPQTERYYGRGGVQNAAVRKDRKDKKKEEPDKKDKKSTGIRVIRGFV